MFDKDFDTWNIYKKAYHAHGPDRLVNEREIWWCALGLNVGSEQDGVGSSFTRPVLIIKRFANSTALVAPLTLKIKEDKHYYILERNGKKSAVLLSHIRTMSTKRFIRIFYRLNDTAFDDIKSAIRDVLR